ncbi:ABC transporter permease [Tindallia californiensis]|uniref:Lipoprotein-releasing system permease protein n=1 Tax=Tindallia californiensis TaxID=159292 RepID=A0A1H3PGT2_9FIRM|nr:ABC transporter permease [Tindallia californiensis]SDZ00346.1 lipoprotein-releasing system permease protein [Tindallia californiensis]
MGFEWKVAFRFLKDGRGQTAFIMLGIAVGVAVQVFLGTLISGLQANLIDNTVGSSAHIIFSGDHRFTGEGASSSTYTHRIDGNFQQEDERLKEWRPLMEALDQHPEMTAVSPLVQGNGFLLRSGVSAPIVFRGVLPERANELYQLEDGLKEGSIQLEGNQILIGSSLAEEYQLQLGDNLTFQLPGDSRQVFTVKGIFDLGSQSINDRWIFLDLSRAQRLLGIGDDIDQLETQIRDVFAADLLAEGLENQFQGITIDHWKEQNADLLSALQSQSGSSITIQVFVLLAITLGIASVLAVSVVQKSKQIGILKAMGTPSHSASRIFLMQGGLLGFLGSLLGILFGFLLTQLFLWGTARATGRALFPLEFDPAAAAVIVAIATTASVISALIPARKSAKLNPIDVIRG